MRARATEPVESIRRARRELRALVVLEWLQMSLAIGALLAIAVWAVFRAEGPGVAVSISVAVALALAHIALSLRVRLGQEPKRRDLYALERDLERDREGAPTIHPYRWSCRDEVRWRDGDWKESARSLDKERASELEQFAGGVAHDISSPLGTVRFALQLAGTSRNEEERARMLKRGAAAVLRVERVASSLLELARAGAKPDPSARADIGAVMADMAAELEPAAVAAGAELTLKCDGTMIVACDERVLTSLIANLTRNAIKYIGDGPIRRIEARVLDRGRSVRVEVEDTGPGLELDVEGRVFDAYARPRTTSQPGLGLGLATVKRLAEGRGGTVGVSSVPGSGCTFWFELPKAPSAPIETFA